MKLYKIWNKRTQRFYAHEGKTFWQKKPNPKNWKYPGIDLKHLEIHLFNLTFVEVLENEKED